MNFLSDIICAKVKLVGHESRWTPDKITRLLVLSILIISNLPLVFMTSSHIKLPLICSQTILFSSTLLMNGNCVLVPSRKLSRAPAIVSNIFWVLILSLLIAPNDSSRLAALLSATACILFLCCVEYLCIFQGMGHWQNVRRMRRAIWFDVAFVLHLLAAWAICLRFCVSPAGRTDAMKALAYLQLVPIMATSLFSDAIGLEKTTVAALVSGANRNFVRYVSHELRSHLNFLAFGLTQLKDEMRDEKTGSDTTSRFNPTASKPPPTAAAATLVDDLEEACDSAVRVLDEILVFDRLRDDVDVTVTKELLDIKPLLRHALDVAEPLVQHPHTETHTHRYNFNIGQPRQWHILFL